ncbi:MAG: Flp/Fap pilin component [Dehalococcoidia bacterium]|nr:Flp/Fap pilin component [Dehalococcoidia bacterium]
MADEWQMVQKRLIMQKSPCDQRGQGLVEYGLIIMLVAVTVIAVLSILGPAVTGAVYSSINSTISGGG